MNKLYFGFAMSSTMFDGNATITRTVVKPETVKRMIAAARNEQKFESCCNPSHKATIDVLKKFDLDIEIPDQPPSVKLGANDGIIVMSVKGLPRLTDRHEYTDSEIAGATFEFVVYQVIGGYTPVWANIIASDVAMQRSIDLLAHHMPERTAAQLAVLIEQIRQF